MLQTVKEKAFFVPQKLTTFNFIFNIQIFKVPSNIIYILDDFLVFSDVFSEASLEELELFPGLSLIEAVSSLGLCPLLARFDLRRLFLGVLVPIRI